MGFVRFGVSVLFCICVAGVGWADNDRATGDEATNEEKAEHEIAKSVLAKAKIDIAKAIETAQAKIPAGKPFYASTASEDNSSLFEVQLLVDGSVTEITVNAITGAIENTEQGEEDDDFEVSKKVLAQSKISFSQAVATARGRVDGGKPFEVWTDLDDGKPVIGVEFLAGDKIVSVQIDALTGKVLVVEENSGAFTVERQIF